MGARDRSGLMSTIRVVLDTETYWSCFQRENSTGCESNRSTSIFAATGAFRLAQGARMFVLGLKTALLLTSTISQNIVVEAYSPLGNNIYNLPRAVDDSTVVSLASTLGKEPAQVLISWAIQRGTVVLPKSVTPSRIKSNLQGQWLLSFFLP